MIAENHNPRAAGAPRPSGLAPLLAVLALAAGLWPAAAPAAEPPLLNQFCETGSAGGQCELPRGVAVDSATGDVYIADQGNGRVQKFDPWGVFERAWGWDVVASGPGNAGTGFEVCVPADGDVCKSGAKGSGRGQLSRPQGVAVDGVGDVYVSEVEFATEESRRVQKFDSEGNFILMFGGGVNKTKVDEGTATEAEENLCPVDPADECQAGSLGGGNGQFGTIAFGAYIAVDPGAPDVVYVGDLERIQKFDTGGHYVEDLPDPDGLLSGRTVQALAVDGASGSLYAGFGRDVNNVFKVDSTSGVSTATCAVERPTAVAVDGEGNVYAYSDERETTPPIRSLVQQFEPACEEVSRFDAHAAGFSDSTGLATSSAPTCGLKAGEVDLLVANSSLANSFVRLYGPPPDPDICPPPPAAPTIRDQHAFTVGSEGATVRAGINPNFWPDTSYWVQYGTAAACRTSEAACEGKALFPGKPLGAGVVKAFTTASAFLGGLEPDTTYHYRFVAESEGGGPAFGEGEGACALEPGCGEGGTFHTYPELSRPPCPNDALRGGLSALLPGCRAYEMVSPVEKNGGDIASGGGSLEFVSPTGTRATFSSFSAFGDPEGAPLSNQYLAERDPDEGWRSEAISPPRSSVPLYAAGLDANGSQFRAFDEELCDGWLVGDSLATYVEGAPEGVPNFYRRRGCAPSPCPLAGQTVEGRCFELLTPVAPPGFSRTTEGSDSRYIPMVQGFSADGSRALLRADAALTADACKAGPNEHKGFFQLYLVRDDGDGIPGLGDVRLVSKMQNGNPACVHASAGTTLGQKRGGVLEDSTWQAVSEDASRIFWTMGSGAELVHQKPVQESGGFEDQPGPLFVRINPEGPEGASSNCNSTLPGEACTTRISNDSETRFRGADREGRTAIYTVGPVNNAELFEYDVDAKAATSIATGVRGVAGMSEDATRVYFASTQAIAGSGQNSEEDEAQAGEANLYLHTKGEGIAFIGTLAAREAIVSTTNPPPSPVAVLANARTSRVSPDGMHLAFVSTAPLTGFDSIDAHSGEPDAQVFLYDAKGGGRLWCASCNPSGARPQGRQMASIDSGEDSIWAAAWLPGWEHMLRPSRLLAEDGDRLFFLSFEQLVLRDANSSQDLYQWERAGGREHCERVLGGEVFLGEDPGAEGGCLSLISAGQGSVDVGFLDASASGDDVFFTSSVGLVPEDGFGLTDVYDARVGGGFPPPPPPEEACEGEACRPAPDPPVPPTPASAALRGEERFTPEPGCARPARRAQRLAGRAKRLRRAAARRSGRATRRLRVRSRRFAGKAKRLSRQAGQCRRRARGVAR
jgi:DNA-binding beta-propeller fold protein YncE